MPFDPFDDPRQVGLLGIASGLLGASGPSRMPISLGQAMGAGLQRGILDRGQAEQIATQKMLREAQAQKIKDDAMRKQYMMSLYAQITDPQERLFAQLNPEEWVKSKIAQHEPKIFGGAETGYFTLGPNQQPRQLVPGVQKQEKDVPLQQAIEKRNSLPVGHPDRQLWDSYIAKLTSNAPVAQVNVDQRAAPKFFDELGQLQAKQFTERRALAQDAATSLSGIKEARKLLDSGMITGIGADYIVGFGKALQKAGVKYNDDAIANSEAFVAAQAKQVAQIIKAFGAGTGLSDADREFAIKAAAGSISLNESSIRRILDINERAFRNVVTRYNKEAAGIPKGTLPYELGVEAPARQVKRTGTYQGRKVVEYDDGTVEFADGQ